MSPRCLSWAVFSYTRLVIIPVALESIYSKSLCVVKSLTDSRCESSDKRRKFNTFRRHSAFGAQQPIDDFPIRTTILHKEQVTTFIQAEFRIRNAAGQCLHVGYRRDAIKPTTGEKNRSLDIAEAIPGIVTGTRTKLASTSPNISIGAPASQRHCHELRPALWMFGSPRLIPT